jgi:hypothetical protein
VREKAFKQFTVVFYGRSSFWRKAAQIGNTLCECARSDFPLGNTLRNIAKNCAKTR